jgi:hypothetical protein
MDKKAKTATAVVVVLAIVLILAASWRADKLNKYLPDKWKHRHGESFIGLNRMGRYTMAPGGAEGVVGMDLNTSDWV